MEDIDGATLDDVRSFFETFYVPNNAVLTLAGDIDPRRALDAVKRYFGEIEPGADIPALPGDPDVGARMGTTVRDHVVSDVPLPRVIMAFRVPPFSSDHFAVARVTGALLGTGRAARFYRRLVRERRIAKSVVTYVYPLLTGQSMMLVWATGYPDTAPAALEAAMSEEIAALRSAEEREVHRAIALTETDLVRTLERLSERADLLSMYDLYFDEPDRLNQELDRLRAVELDQIREFVEERLGEDNRAVVTYEPEADR